MNIKNYVKQCVALCLGGGIVHVIAGCCRGHQQSHCVG